MAFRRNRRGLWPWLAASLATHGIAFGALVVAASHSPSDLRAGMGRADGVLLVRLLGVSTTASGDVPSAPNAGASDRAMESQSAAAPVPRLERTSRQPEPRRALPRPRRNPRGQPIPSTPDPTPRQQPAPRQAETGMDISMADAGPPPATGVQPERDEPSPTLQLVASLPPRRSGSAGPAGAPAGGGAASGHEGGRLDRLARPASPIEPLYPPRARQRGDEGDVIVDVWVGSGGQADQVAVAQSAGSDFDRAALAAVRGARFHPALRDGQRVPSRLALRVHFQLEQ